MSEYKFKEFEKIDLFNVSDKQVVEWDNQEDKETEGRKMQILFGNKRIVLLAGDKDCGKTNNLISLILDFRKENTHTPIYLYGINESVFQFLNSKIGGIYKITSLKQMVGKSGALFIIDEFQKLKLNDRRSKEVLDGVCDMIYHKDNNNRILLCSPNLREINSIIGSRIERWACKSITYDALIHGSQLQEAVKDYKGSLKQMGNIVIPKNRILILGEKIDTQLVVPYIKEADDKQDIIDIFTSTKELSEIKRKMSENEQKETKKLSEKKYPLGV